MKKIDVLTIGGATVDIMMYTNECVILDNPQDLTRQKLIAFEYGAKINTDEVYLTYGGGAFNTAVNFANLGLKTALRAQLGDDSWGVEILKYLKKRKIKTDLITIQPKGHTGTSIIVNVGRHNEHVIFLFRGANHVIEIKTKELSLYRPEWIYLTSLTGAKARLNIDKIFKHSQAKKIKISWNPGNEQLALGFRGLKKYLSQVTVFNVNKDEAIELSLSAGRKTTKINELLKILKSWGPQIAVITDGPKGAYAFDGHSVYFTKALPIKGINTTGAGDSFGSTFIAGLLKTGDVEFSLKAAIINSNYVIQKIGAQKGLLNWEEINKLIKKHKLV